MLTVEDYADFVAAVHPPSREARRTPFPWQLRLARDVVENGWSAIGYVDAPTGLGKTSVLDIAVFTAAMAAERREQPPRRYFFVVDRRVVVDEAHEHASRIARALQASNAPPILRQVAEALKGLARGTDTPVEVSRMRGGVTWDWRWIPRPDQVGLVTGTVDQVGSRLLFRGYGVTERRYSIDAGMVGTDSVLFVDEAHLAVPMLRTVGAAQRLDHGERHVRPPATVVTLSATQAKETIDASVQPAEFDVEAHLAHDEAARRLRAAKRLVTAHSPANKLPEVMAAAARQATVDTPGGLVAVVANTVATARRVFDLLTDFGEHRLLVTGRSRPLEREALLSGWLDRLTIGWRATGWEQTRVLVATQTVEVGANLDLDVLVTESAPWSNLVQRLGRLNRVGAAPSSLGVVVHPETDRLPVYGELTQATWDWLSPRVKAANWSSPKAVAASWKDATGKGLEVSPLALRAMRDGEDPPPEATLAPHGPALVQAHLDCWARTGPVPEPDVPVAPFLHGFDAQPAAVRVVWRADLQKSDLESRSEEALAQARFRVRALPPKQDEVLEVPLLAFRSWLRQEADAPVTDDESAAPPAERRPSEEPGRPVLRIRDINEDTGVTIGTGQDLRPGDLVIVPSKYGGCDAFGWAPRSTAPVLDVGDLCSAAPARMSRAAVLRLDRDVLAPLVERLLGPEAPLLHDLESAIENLAEARRESDEDVPLDPDWAAEDGPQAALRAVLDVLDGVADRDGQQRLHTALTSRWDQLWQRVRRGQVLAPTDDPNGPLLISERRARAWDADDSGAGGSSHVGRRQTLDEHQAHVAALAALFAESMSMPTELCQTVRLAGARHDVGKLDPRFQRMLAYGGETASVPLAKSGMPPQAARLRREARQASGYPAGGRHEALSGTLVAAELRTGHDSGLDPELLLHLVTSHHGHARPLLPPVTDPGRSAAIECAGRSVSTSNEVDWSAVERFERLQWRYGRWGLALLESVVRLADIASSAGEYEELPGDHRALQPLPPSPVRGDTSAHRRVVTLPALEGRNPLGFLAALGALRLLSRREPQVSLSWDPESGAARLHCARWTDVDDVVDELWAVRSSLQDGQFWPDGPVGFPPPREAPDPLVVGREEFADLLSTWRDAGAVLTALVTDLAVNNDGRIRRTPMVAPTGKQSFFTMVRNQHRATSSRDSVRQALNGWRRVTGVPAEGFDASAILTAADAPDGKPAERSVPGATWLAIQALPGLRLAGDLRRPSATAWRRQGRDALMVWPLWSPALAWDAIVALLEHPQVRVEHAGRRLAARLDQLRPLGVWQVCAARRRPTGNSDGPLVPATVLPTR